MARFKPRLPPPPNLAADGGLAFMVAVVNGYVCFTTCDAKKAKQGEDPLALNGAAQDGKDG
jgi:hypothetical protein